MPTGIYKHNVTDLTGQVFNRLTVNEYAGRDKRGKSRWKVLCSCGTTLTVRGSSITSGNTESCGCLQKETTSTANRTHGNAAHGKRSLAYQSWRNMIQRCTNPKFNYWELYGGRGVRVCTRWLNSFEKFLEDMGKRPKNKTNDRINPNGHYIPSNCRWATLRQQNNNRRQRGSKEPVIAFVDVE